MADRDKVIKECKWAIDQIMANGSTTITTKGFFRDVIRLLKEDEPHVLTLDEALSADVCWYDSAWIHNPAYGSLKRSDGTPTVQIIRLEEGPAYEDVNSYGTSWRCWNRRPSEEQRRTAEWQE